MHSYRKTAIVRLVLFSEATEGSLPLATEREFAVTLTIDGASVPAQNFQSPINDEQWRQFYARLRGCNINHAPAGARDAAAIRSLCRQLYQNLVAISPALRNFLQRTDERRLVIETTRPELHLLPWAAMIDDAGTFLAASDLSVVQCVADFNTMPATTGSTLRLMSVSCLDTKQMTADALTQLPAEIKVVDGLQAFTARMPVNDIDILNLEAHGNAVTNEIDGVTANEFASTFAAVKIALLWSCSSGAVNSWGESPALCLHRSGAEFVVSFLAELHDLDAKSISTQFYREVFGPAASRDPETALVRIRADKFQRIDEFSNANWASMTVYMRAPLDLSALPLNGPRVPQGAWRGQQTAPSAEDPCACPDVSPVDVPTTSPGESPDAATNTSPAHSPAPASPYGNYKSAVDQLWAGLDETVTKLQAGTINEFKGFEDLPRSATALLPLDPFKAWRGNVIRIDGDGDVFWDDTLAELHVSTDDMPNSDQADKLVWFFNKIDRYGSPLIVWTNAAARHMNFLQNVSPNSTLTFLLIYGPQPETTLIDLVSQDRLKEAQEACASLPDNCGDDLLSAAYFAFARSEDIETAKAYLRRISYPAELLLLVANFISRRGVIPNPKPDWMQHHPDGTLTNLQQQHCQEDCFRRVMSPDTHALRRELGRAKHELGYMLQSLGKDTVAEMLYGQALADLEGCPTEQHDYRWHDALGKVLRDWADLLSQSPERLDKASELLDRAMAIHSFHGRRLQIAYCLDTAARIALTGGRHSSAIENAVDAANLFEVLNNWRGWGEAMKILFDCLAETRETARMHSMADLAIAKLEKSNLPADRREGLRRAFTYEKANANWIAGKLAEARTELEKLGQDASDPARAGVDPEFESNVKRLWHFLAIAPAS
jgi:tetratricopeptide (TPR) repeat protein